MQVMLVLSNMDFQTWPDYAHCRVLICQLERQTLIPWYGITVWIISQLSGGRLTKLVHCYHGKEVFCSYWNRHLHCIHICLSACDASSKTTICTPYRILTVMMFHKALLLMKKISSHQNKCGNGPMLMGLIDSPLSWLDWMMEWPFEDSKLLMGSPIFVPHAQPLITRISISSH